MTNDAITSQIPSADVELAAQVNPWVGLFALWRHAVWFSLFFAVVLFALFVRLDVQASVVGLERTAHLAQEATLQQERLLLEVQTRHRAVAMEELARALELAPAPTVVQP